MISQPQHLWGRAVVDTELGIHNTTFKLPWSFLDRGAFSREKLGLLILELYS
jgi:hypothetical protein